MAESMAVLLTEALVGDESFPVHKILFFAKITKNCEKNAVICLKSRIFAL